MLAAVTITRNIVYIIYTFILRILIDMAKCYGMKTIRPRMETIYRFNVFRIGKLSVCVCVQVCLYLISFLCFHILFPFFFCFLILELQVCKFIRNDIIIPDHFSTDFTILNGFTSRRMLSIVFFLYFIQFLPNERNEH